MRGGTSKGAFLLESDLPEDPAVRDQVILDIYGSPDIRQINGIGGSDPLTSKVALIRPSLRPDADVDYTFGYVGITEPYVDYSGNCGNMISAVGPYAVYKGLVPITEPFTTVRIHNTNTNKIVVARVPVTDGELDLFGDYAISGVPGTAARIELEFLHAGGEKTKKLLPTGNVRDRITLSDGRTIEVTCCDAGNPGIIVRAEDIGFTSQERPDTPEADQLLLLMEEIRRIGSVLMGLSRDTRKVSPAIPKIVVAAPPQMFRTVQAEFHRASEVNLICRTMALNYFHKAYAVTTGICTAAAASIPGTVVHDIARPAAGDGTFYIGHPSGILDIIVQIGENEQGFYVKKAAMSRTANLLMEGQAFVRRDVWEGKAAAAAEI